MAAAALDAGAVLAAGAWGQGRERGVGFILVVAVRYLFASNENVAAAVTWGMLGNILGLLFALGAMAALGAQARQAGHALKVDAGTVPRGTFAGMPEGWSVVLAEPLVVRANGACNGTRGELQSGTYVRQFELAAPFCRPRLDPTGPS